jgi:D-alanine transfer protein
MHGHDSPSQGTPHLGPAFAAVIFGAIVVTVFEWYARDLESRSILALATNDAIIARNGGLQPIKNQGVALQQAAVEADCLLPVYGSSELNLQAPYNLPFQPTSVFREFPTGFTIFPVGKAETTCLLILQKLAAVGPELRGRKVAISLSPYWFFDRLAARPDAYAGNFSALQAGELAFSTHLGLELRADAARRMLKYPATLANRPLLKLALENLADGSPLSLACYEAIVPLGLTHNAFLRFQDHWSVVCYLWKHPVSGFGTRKALAERGFDPLTQADGSSRGSPSLAALESKSMGSPRRLSPRGPQLDWAEFFRRADATYRLHSTNNQFGLDDKKWKRELRQELLRQKASLSERSFLRTLQRSQEWVDLDLLLRGSTEMGMRPLLLSMPIHGGWYDECGISCAARGAYYQKLREIAARHHVPVIDFADHDADRSFCHDNLGHLAPRGLVHYSQVFDAFFHDALSSLSQLPSMATGSPGTTLPTGPGR